MAVYVQRRRPTATGRDEIATYAYDRVYRLERSVVAVGWLNGPDGSEHDQFREFMDHSIDEVLFERATVLPRSLMLLDLQDGVDAPADDVPGRVVMYE